MNKLIALRAVARKKNLQVAEETFVENQVDRYDTEYAERAAETIFNLAIENTLTEAQISEMVTKMFDNDVDLEIARVVFEQCLNDVKEYYTLSEDINPATVIQEIAEFAAAHFVNKDVLLEAGGEVASVSEYVPYTVSEVIHQDERQILVASYTNPDYVKKYYSDQKGKNKYDYGTSNVTLARFVFGEGSNYVSSFSMTMKEAVKFSDAFKN